MGGENMPRIESYLSENHYLTRRQMMIRFGLSPYKAAQWLNLFVEQGKLTKQGSRAQMLYFMA